MTRQICFGFVTAMVLMVCLDTADGQNRSRMYGQSRLPGSRTYQPSRPTLSPYLNLLRARTSVLPNYQAFVRPVQRQQMLNRQAATRFQQIDDQTALLDETTMDLQQQVDQFGVQQVGIRPTGVHGQFQYYSHYYTRP